MAIDAGAVVLPVEPGASDFARNLARQIGGQTRAFTSLGRELGGKVAAGMFSNADAGGFTRKLQQGVARDTGGFTKTGKDIGEKIGDGISDALDGVSARVGTRIGPGFASIGGKLGGKVIGGFAALGVGAVIAGEIGKGLDTEEANDKLAAQLGLTGKVAEKAGRAAGNLYAGAYGDSIGQVNDALKGIQDNIGNLGKFTRGQLESMGAKALDLATILDEDVGRTTRAAGQLMRNNLAPNATAAFDLITRAQQRGGNAAGDLLDTIEEYAPSFKELGLTGPQALGAISASLRAGARNGDLAADAIKEFSIRAIDGSESTKDGFKALELNAKDMAGAIASGGPSARKAFSTVLTELGKIKDPVKQEAAGVALFGTQFEDLGIKAILALNPTKNALDDVGGASKRMGKTLADNAKTNIESFKRTLSGVATDVIGNHVIPALKDAAAGAQRLGDRFGPYIKTAIDVGRKAFAAIAPIIRDVADTVSRFVERVQEWFGSGGGVQQALGSNRRFFSETFNQIRGIVKSALDLIRVIIKNFTESAREFWDRWGATILKIAGHVWQAIKEVIRGVLNVIQGIIKTVTAAIRGDWRGVWEGIKKILDGVWDAMFGIVRGAVKSIGDVLSNWWQNQREKWRNFWDGVRTTARNAWESLKDGARGVVAALGNAFNSLKSKVAAPINWIISRVINGGIIKAWNSLMRALGFGSLTVGGVNLVNSGSSTGRTSPGTFAKGGPVPAWAGDHQVPILAEAGEFVIRKDIVDKIGMRTFEALNKYGLVPPTGGDPPGVRRYAAGGLVAAKRFAQAQSGKPYIWGGVGPGGYDCSGFMSAILNVLEGKAPYSRRFTTSSISSGNGIVAGLVPDRGAFNIGSYVGNPGHMAGTLDGVDVEAGGTSGNVGYGGDASGARHPRFNRKWHASAAFSLIDTIKDLLGKVVDRILGGVSNLIRSHLDPPFETLGVGLVNRARASVFDPKAVEKRAAADGFMGTVRSPMSLTVGEGGRPEDVIVWPHKYGRLELREPGGVSLEGATIYIQSDDMPAGIRGVVRQVQFDDSRWTRHHIRGGGRR
jgi:phage-related minor tail protein